jgi:hypothetical protein
MNRTQPRASFKQVRSHAGFRLLLTAVFATALPAPAAADPMRPLPAMRPASAPQQAPLPARSGRQLPVSLPAFHVQGTQGWQGSQGGAADFANAQAASSQAPAPPLWAIREDADGQRRALIGEDWLRAGQSLPTRPGTPAVRLTHIGPTSVELQQGKERHTVRLLPVLTPSAAAPAATAASAAPFSVAANPAATPATRGQKAKP